MSALCGATVAPLGTLPYHAPEQVEGLVTSAASDQYALAETACWLLSGQNSAQGGLTRIGEEHFEVAAVLTRALASDPNKRYPSMVLFSRALGYAALAGCERQASIPLLPARPTVPLPRTSVGAGGYRSTSQL